MSGLRLLAVGLFATALACAPPQVGAGAERRWNVVLVSIDTLRADHLGCYGYDRPTSPAIDEFAAGGVTFTQTIAHAPSTLPSHASILTSLLPHHHNASWEAGRPLPDQALTLAEVLQGAGYATAAFTGGGQMDRVFGLGQGFDTWAQSKNARFGATVREAVPWLRAHTARPFFLFLHSYEPHHPYEPPPAYLAAIENASYAGTLPDTISVELLRQINSGEFAVDEADLAHIVAAYDAEIRSMDDGFSALVRTLRGAALWDRTLVVFTSDHGEELGERGNVGWHSHSLYDEQLRVPLIFKLPRNAYAGHRVERQVRSLDIAPTVLAVLGIPPPAQFRGVDLTAFLRGEPVPPLLAVSKRDLAARDLTSVRTEEWKLQPGALFHLAGDPGEQWSILHPGAETDLQAALAAELAAGPSVPPAEQVVPPGSTLAELKALGYVQ